MTILFYVPAVLGYLLILFNVQAISVNQQASLALHFGNSHISYLLHFQHEKVASENGEIIPTQKSQLHMQAAVEQSSHNTLLTAPEILAFTIKKIKRKAEFILGYNISEAVASVPMNMYTDAQRQVVKDVGTIAGLNFQIILSPVTAAAIAYDLDQHSRQDSGSVKHYVLFHLGASTLSTSLFSVDEGVIEKLRSEVRVDFGGDLLNRNLMTFYVSMIHNTTGVNITENTTIMYELREQIEIAKRELSTRHTTDVSLLVATVNTCNTSANSIDNSGMHRDKRADNINCTVQFQLNSSDTPDTISFTHTLTRLTFNRLNTAFFKEITSHMIHLFNFSDTSFNSGSGDQYHEYLLVPDNAEGNQPAPAVAKYRYITPQDISGVILTGGNTLIPAVRSLITTTFNRADTAIYDSIDPQFVYAVGVAKREARRYADPKEVEYGTCCLCFDLVPIAIGVEIFGGISSKIVNQNQLVPVQETKRYTVHRKHRISGNNNIDSSYNNNSNNSQNNTATGNSDNQNNSSPSAWDENILSIRIFEGNRAEMQHNHHIATLHLNLSGIIDADKNKHTISRNNDNNNNSIIDIDDTMYCETAIKLDITVEVQAAEDQCNCGDIGALRVTTKIVNNTYIHSDDSTVDTDSTTDSNADSTADSTTTSVVVPKGSGRWGVSEVEYHDCVAKSFDEGDIRLLTRFHSALHSTTQENYKIKHNNEPATGMHNEHTKHTEIESCPSAAGGCVSTSKFRSKSATTDITADDSLLSTPKYIVLPDYSSEKDGFRSFVSRVHNHPLYTGYINSELCNIQRNSCDNNADVCGVGERTVCDDVAGCVDNEYRHDQNNGVESEVATDSSSNDDSGGVSGSESDGGRNDCEVFRLPQEEKKFCPGCNTWFGGNEYVF